MALIACADCGKEMSDAAVACPSCGRPSPAVIEANTVTWHHVVLVAVAAVTIIGGWFYYTEYSHMGCVQSCQKAKQRTGVSMSDGYAQCDVSCTQVGR